MWNRYLRAIAFSFLAVVAGVGGINWLIDPFGIFASPQIAGINSKKTEAVTHGRLNKFGTLERQNPRTLIIGSSRAEYGLDPDHPGFSERPVYNFAVVGPRIYEFLRTFQHVEHAVKPRQILFALDFFAFNGNFPTEPDFSEDRFVVSPAGEVHLFYPLDRAQERTSVLFSMDTLAASWTTITSQKDATHFMLPNGLQDRSNFDNAIHGMGGYRNAFRGSERRYLSDDIFPKPTRRFDFNDRLTNRSTLEDFAEILRICHENHIKLTLMISPIHARLLETIRTADLWDTYEDWKRQLATINEREAKATKENAYPLWDFADYHELNSETVPDRNDNSTRMAWWWESSHYKKQLGDVVLARIFNTPAPAGIDSEHFGTPISASNIDAHLQQVRARQQQYENTHPEDITEIDALREFIANLK